MTERRAFLTNELVPDPIPLLEVGGTVDDAVNEGQYGRFMGDGLRSLQFVDHGTESVGLVRLPLKCEDSTITRRNTLQKWHENSCTFKSWKFEDRKTWIFKDNLKIFKAK